MTKKDLTSETAPDTYDVAAEARARGIEPYQVRAANAVNDQLVADLVADFRRGATAPASMASRPHQPKPETKKGTGWQDPAPLTSPPGTRYVDQIAESFARQDRIAAMRQANESAEIERQFRERNSPRRGKSYNPLEEYDRGVPSFHRDKKK